MSNPRLALAAGVALACAIVSPAVHAAGPVPQFGPATPVTTLNSSGQDAPNWITPDGLQIVITSNRAGGGLKLYGASRPNLTSPFGTPSATDFAQPNATSFDTRDAVLSPDGLELFYSDEEQQPQTHTTVYRATRANTASPFSNLQPMPGLSVTSALTFPSWLSPDSLRLYEYDNAGHAYVASRATPASPFGTPSAAPLANLGYTDRFTLTPDELQIFYYHGDIYWSSRASASDPFPAGVPVPTLSGIGAAVPALTLVGNTMYMNIGQDIYSAALLPEPTAIAPIALGLIASLPLRRRRLNPA